MLKISRRTAVLTYSLIILLIASCGAAEPTEEESAGLEDILTAGVGTLAASIFETQTALVTPATATEDATSTATNTALPLPGTASPSATQGFVFAPAVVSVTVTGTQYTPTANPLTLASGCNNLLLISDVTIPAGTVMQPREQFTKTWKVGNNGTCDWALQYRLVFTGGDQMGGEPSGLGRVIEPNKWTQISIGLVAPRQPGTYTGSWRLGTQSGTPFGSTLTVRIVVAAPTNTPQPTLSPTPVTPSNTPPPTDTPTETPTTP